MCCLNMLLQGLSTSCVTLVGQNHWKLAPDFLGLCPIHLFSVVCIYPFIIINHSHEYDYMLSTISILSKSQSLEMVLGNTPPPPPESARMSFLFPLRRDVTANINSQLLAFESQKPRLRGPDASNDEYSWSDPPSPPNKAWNILLGRGQRRTEGKSRHRD